MLKMSSCNVCIENYNKSTKCAIICEFCEFDSCRVCCSNYILNSYEVPHCMNCKKEWNREFLTKTFTKKFINKELKEKREKILLERERALLPSTQPAVEFEIKKEMQSNKIRELKEKINELRNQLYDEEVKYYKMVRKEEESYGKTKFIKKCPNDNCRGFLDDTYKCGLCDTKCCNRCHEIKNLNHKCNEEIVETIKLLKSDSKSCPKCGVYIFKIEGCNQMFCTQCHIAFDWNSGRIESGTIHNPHYYQWLRSNGQLERNPGEIVCGREIDNNFIINLINVGHRKNLENLNWWSTILTISREITHIQHVELPRIRPNIIRDNIDLRIRYLRNQITEEQFKSALQKREKSNEKKRELSNILGMYATSATEIIYRLFENLNLKENFEHKIYIKELKNLMKYANECLENVSKVYNCKVYKINERGKFL